MRRPKSPIDDTKSFQRLSSVLASAKVLIPFGTGCWYLVEKGTGPFSGGVAPVTLEAISAVIGTGGRVNEAMRVKMVSEFWMACTSLP